MRIRSLRLAGFGPYKDPQHIDFDTYARDGIFLINGKTGAGKSTILDAIFYALYGTVARYVGGTPPRLRSDFADQDDPTYVTLEFTLGAHDYRIHRTPEYERPAKRANKSGTGLTRQAASVELSILREGDRRGEWETIAAKAREAEREIHAILPLNGEQFSQVIMLAQNDFQRFLLAKQDERQAVLRTLFGTKRFEQIESAIAEKVKALGVDVEQSARLFDQHATNVATLLGDVTFSGADEEDALAIPEELNLAWFENLNSLLSDEVEQNAALLSSADQQLDESTRAHNATLSAIERQKRRNVARETLAELEDAMDEYDLKRAQLERANAAATVWPLAEAHAAAEEASSEAALARESALAGWREAEETVVKNLAAGSAKSAGSDGSQPADSSIPSAELLSAEIESLDKTLGALAALAADEDRVRQLAGQIATAEASSEQNREKAAEVGRAMETLPGEIDRILGELGRASAIEATEAVARAKLDDLNRKHTAARAAEELRSELVEARKAESLAAEANMQAAAYLDTLIRNQLANSAATLARNLDDGQPCPVCGSCDHPSPAVAQDEPVTEQQVDDARLSVEKAHATLAASGAAVSTKHLQLTEQLTVSDNLAEQRLEVLIATATDELTQAREAAVLVVVLTSRRDSLEHQLADARTLASSLEAAHASLSAELAAAHSESTSLSDRLRAQLGPYESIAQKIVHTAARRDAASLLFNAISRAERTEETLAASRDALGKQLTHHGFDAAGMEPAARVREHLLAEDQVTILDAAIREYEQQLATNRSILQDPEFADLPEDIIDHGPTAAVVEESTAIRNRTAGTAASLANQLSQLARIVSLARTDESGLHELREHHQRLRRLSQTLAGHEPNERKMRLETYVLAAQLEEIVRAANHRLRVITDGRYSLEHDDSLQSRGLRSGLGLRVLDANTGRARPPHSLSGGETFLASLALALGLAEVVTNQAGGVQLDTLFIDEGFGSLDSETLSTAMHTIDGLRAGGRVIGLISHVDAMKDQIPSQLSIYTTPHGYSAIRPVLLGHE